MGRVSTRSAAGRHFSVQRDHEDTVLEGTKQQSERQRLEGRSGKPRRAENGGTGSYTCATSSQK